MTVPVSPGKPEQRATIKALRARLDPVWSADASRVITDQLLALPDVNEAETVAAFLALPYEPNLDDVITRLQAAGKTVLVPAFVEKTRQYRLCRLDSGPLIRKRFGVREPATPRWADDVSPDLWLIPGVGFDPAGNRLGHGAGYYDRLLAGASGRRAGIAFACQWLDEIDVEAHDVGVHLVVTEQGTHRV